MLSLSAKTIYGLKATLFLAEHFDQGLLTIKEIAAARTIPRQYLEQIFNQLGKAEIIRSVRGKYGGYQLARSPGKIPVAEIVTALEGNIELAPNTNEPVDVIHDLLKEAEQALAKVFSLTLAELVELSRKKRQVINFVI
ncbi:MAG: Rrf2 family transcriptional regulator [Desulfobulbaceae bacterium]|nr:Rrf2 family transcriptional regulator [Desulfobulbaceae bacterium]